MAMAVNIQASKKEKREKQLEAAIAIPVRWELKQNRRIPSVLKKR